MSNLLAVFIPVFNNREGLLSSLNSLQGQIPFEHIFVVDDGSDVPVTLPDTYCINLLRLPKNEGIVAARNAGLKMILNANYQFIALLDAGDICLPTRLEKQLNFLLSNKDVAIVGSAVSFTDMQGKHLFFFKPPLLDNDIKRAMFFNCQFCNPSVMMRMNALNDVGGYNPDFQYAEDYEIFRRILSKYKGANLSDVLLNYEINPEGISLSKRKQLLDARMRVQLRYFEYQSFGAWLGVAQTLILSLIPNQLLIMIKRLKG